jgi:phosphoglycerate kinase
MAEKTPAPPAPQPDASARRRSVTDLQDDQIRGKRALVRVDFNVPVDAAGQISDDTRIRAAVPTIRYLADRGARVVLHSHLGRPKGGKPDPKYSLRPVALRAAEVLGQPVGFCETTDTDAAVNATNALAPGAILLLENTRFLAGEETNDPKLAAALARLGDFFVNDAFGAAHRAHASTEGVAHLLHPAVAGLLMEKELSYLGRALANPKRPFVAILGGAKISGKMDVIANLLPQVDGMLIGGAMACTFFQAMGLNVGTSLVEPDRVPMAKDLLARAGARLTLPHDVRVAPSLDQAAQSHVVPRSQIPAKEAVFDIGPETSASFARAIATAKTVLWNGPMGVFEAPPFDAGTLAVARAMAAATSKGTTTIVGGGDSAAAVVEAGLESAMSHVSTGGGASLEYLEGKILPGVAALDVAS